MKKIVSLAVLIGLTATVADAAPSYLTRNQDGGYKVTYDYTDKAEVGNWYIGGRLELNIMNWENESKTTGPDSEMLDDESFTEALFGGNTTEQFIESLNIVRLGGFGIVLALGVLAIFLISNTIKITIFARQDEIVIMRHVGATNGYIRTPFVLEGMVIGILGSIIPIIITYFGYNYVYDINTKKYYAWGDFETEKQDIIIQA